MIIYQKEALEIFSVIWQYKKKTPQSFSKFEIDPHTNFTIFILTSPPQKKMDK